MLRNQKEYISIKVLHSLNSIKLSFLFQGEKLSIRSMFVCELIRNESVFFFFFLTSTVFNKETQSSFRIVTSKFCLLQKLEFLSYN